MKQYTVTGMSCAACSSRVEKAVTKVPGVTSCSVSLLTNSMGVEGSASDAEIIQAVENAGYGAAVKTSASQNKNTMGNPEDELLKDKETPVLKRRLLTSLGFLVVLMYFSMGHMMWGWPLPKWLAENHVAQGILQLLLVVLEGIQVVVPAVEGQQLLVVALFDDLTVGQQDDVVGMLDGGQTVGNDQHGADVLHLFQRILDQQFGLGVDVGGGLVQDHDGGLVDNSAGKA